MKKEAEKEKKAASRRIKDSKDKDEEKVELAAIKVSQTVQQQIRDFKVKTDVKMTWFAFNFGLRSIMVWKMSNNEKMVNTQRTSIELWMHTGGC